MLKELFVLKNGTPLFYWSGESVDEETIDQSLLSSGILSAISSFSEETRSSAVDSFTSEKEVFQFLKLGKFNAIIVGAFAIDITEEMAKLVLNHLKSELLEQEIIREETLNELNAVEKEDFAKQIPNLIANMMDDEIKQSYLTNLVQRVEGVFLAYSIKLDSREVNWKYASPPPMYRSEYLNDTLLIMRIATNMIQKLGLGENMKLLTMQNKERIIAISDNGYNLNTIVSSLAARDKLEKVVMRMGYQDSLLGSIEIGDRLAKYQFSAGNLEHHSGNAILPPNAHIFLTTLMNNVSNIFGKIFRAAEAEFVRVVYEQADGEIDLLVINQDDQGKLFITVY